MKWTIKQKFAYVWVISLTSLIVVFPIVVFIGQIFEWIHRNDYVVPENPPDPPVVPPQHISVRITNSIVCLVLFLVAFFFNSLIISVFYDLGMKNL